MSEIETSVFKIPAVPAFKRMKNPAEKKSCTNLDEKKNTEDGGIESREKDSTEAKRKHNRKLNDAPSLTLENRCAMVQSTKRRKKKNQQRFHRHLQMKKQKFNDFYVGPLTLNKAKSSDLIEEEDAIRLEDSIKMSMMAKKGNIWLSPNGLPDYRLVRQNAFYKTWPIQSTW